MKVYVLSYVDYDCSEPIAVYESKREAESKIGKHYEIEEVDFYPIEIGFHDVDEFYKE
jgi:hypothetical protein